LALVIAGALVMVAVAFVFYANWQHDIEASGRIYGETPDFMLYAEQDTYLMARGDTIQIPIIIDIDQKGREASAQVAVFGVGVIDAPDNVFVETGEQTLPAGFSGALDRSSIHLPAGGQGEVKTEIVFLTLTSGEDAAAGDHALHPTLFSHDAGGNPFAVSSSFTVRVE
jgi:hypothetical protein